MCKIELSFVIILSGPTSVRNLMYESRFFSVILSWDIPDSLNGILLYYNVKYTVNETNRKLETVKFNTFSISNLYPNTSITNVSVFATNQEGDGEPVILEITSTLEKPSTS